MPFLYSLLLSVKDLGTSQIKKLSVINGLIWFFIWLIIGFLTWKKMIIFTSNLLNFFPFSFIQLSSAQVIFTLLWIQAIFITIGILFAFFNEFIEKQLEKTHFHYLSISIGILIIIFWSYIFLANKTTIENYLIHILKILPFQTVQEIMSVFLGLLFFYLLFCASISLNFIFLIIPKLKQFTDKYPQIKINKISYIKLISISIRDLFIYIIGAIILYPFMIIPWFNIITLTFLWAYMIKDSYTHIIESLFNIKFTKKEKWSLSIISIIFNFLPIINIFAPAFGILNFYHYGIEKKLNS